MVFKPRFPLTSGGILCTTEMSWTRTKWEHILGKDAMPDNAAGCSSAVPSLQQGLLRRRSLPQTEHFWGLRKVDSKCQCCGRTYNLQVRKSPSTWYLTRTFTILPYSHVGGSWIACIRLDILRSECQARIKAVRILLVEVPEWKKNNKNQRKLEEYHQNAILTLNNGQKEQIGRKHPRLPCNSRKFQQNLWEVLGPTVSWQSSPVFPWTALAPPPQVVTGRGQPTKCRHNGGVWSSHQISVSSAI